MTKEEIVQGLYKGNSRAIKEAIKALEQQSSDDDCVSRQAVDHLCFEYLRPNTDDNIAFYEHFRDLPSVTPTRKIGKWIDGGRIDKGTFKRYKCSNCQDNVYEKEYLIKYHKYCLHCGAEMRGDEE